jgi:hypothetical protein
MYETRVTSQKINYAHPPCPISAALLARIIEADRPRPSSHGPQRAG